MTATRGVLLFARNNSQVDYVKQAKFVAQSVREHLDLPTTLVTDSIEYLENEYPDYKSIFDKVIKIVWQDEQLHKDTILSLSEKHSIKRFYDGSLVSKNLEWKNNLRSSAYQASPYDETLVLDTDIVICNDNFRQCFFQTHDFLIYKDCVELLDCDRGDLLTRVSDSSIDFYWATAVFFRKTETNKIFFQLIQHIQENWSHYCSVFQINTPYFRNDYAFSIAIHIMNGYQIGDFAKPMPGTLYFVTDKSILWQIKQKELLVLLEKQNYVGEYTPISIKDCNLHVMNKFSLNRCIDEG
jgi:hypothetical protein